MQEFEAYAAANCVKNNLKVFGVNSAATFSSANRPYKDVITYRGDGIFCPHGLTTRAVTSNWTSSSNPGVGFSYSISDMNMRPILTNMRYGGETLTAMTSFMDGGYYLAPNEYFNMEVTFTPGARLIVFVTYGIEYIFSSDFMDKFLTKFANSRLSVRR